MRTKLCAAGLMAATLTLCAAGCREPGPSPAWLAPGGGAQLLVKASVDVGQAKHLEDSNLVDLKSDWESLMARPRVVLDLRTRIGFEASAQASGLFTNNEDENWKTGGVEVSDNELEITYWEFRALAGWSLEVEDLGHFSVLGGLAGRFVELDRKFDDGSRAKVDSDLFFLEVELRAVMPLGREALGFPVNFEASASYGWLLEPEAEVPGAGTIEGDGGGLLRLRVGMDFRFSERLSVYLGGYWEVLKIQGGTEGIYEWADSESTAGGGEVGLRLRF